jgi:RNA polymerase sigma factor for flagellar operon FliA
MDPARLNPQQQRWVEQAMSRVGVLARALGPRLTHIAVDELQSAGYEGLVEAALRYDPSSGIPFGAFAHYRIRGAMIDAARRASPAIRRQSRALRMLQTTQALLEQAQRGEARPDALDPRSLKERVAAAAEVVAQTTTAVLLSKLPPPDPDRVRTDADLSAEDRLLQAERKHAVQAQLEGCSPDERNMVRALYFEGKSMTEYAAEVGKSASTVSRHHARLISRLSKRLRRSLGEDL